MKQAVRVGIVGVGSIALRGLLPHLTMQDVQNRVRDRWPSVIRCWNVRKRRPQGFDVPAAYASMEEMLAAGGLDAVSIASPIGFHYAQGKLAIDHGLHIHFNKTMTTTVAEADDLIAAAAKANEVKLVCLARRDGSTRGLQKFGN